MGPPSTADPAVNGQPPKLQSVKIALDIIDALAEAPELGLTISNIRYTGIKRQPVFICSHINFISLLAGTIIHIVIEGERNGNTLINHRTAVH